MNHLFSINAEGGPLLCLDARAAVKWKGAEDRAKDYKMLCSKIDNKPDFSAAVLPICGTACAVWEMAGAGTADVFLQPSGNLCIVRAWLATDPGDELAKLAGGDPILRQEIGEIDLPSGTLAVLWAPESGLAVPETIDIPFRSVKGTAINDSVFVIKAAFGRYRCCDDQIELGNSRARRLTLIPSKL